MKFGCKFLILAAECRTLQTTEIQLPVDNPKLLQRIKISLQAINLNDVEIQEEDIEFDYQY